MLRKVKTENGWLQGIPAADPRITAFKGIPFAKAPVGDLRWKAPQAAENWEGVRDASRFAPISVQWTPGGGDPEDLYNKEWHVDPKTPMSEDCLYLNVWTPARSEDEKLPVMFWIFGGGLQCGYPSEMEFDGERIARRGVVLVSVNYRVNIFGFMAHPELSAEDPAAATNFGLLDQKAGLEWVQRNIASFGGDPDNVTIFGQSAGGGSVTMHLTSPLTEGLFHKAIIQSGGGLLPPGRLHLTLEEAEQKGKSFLDAIGLSSLEEARKIDAKELFKLCEAHMPWGSVTDGRYLVETPTETFVKGKHKMIPLMIGNTGNEFLVKPNFNSVEELHKYLEEVYGDKKEDFLKIALKDGNDLESAAKNLTYNRFEIGNTLMCEVNARINGARIYNYYFDPEIPGDDNGSFHSSELWFTFETLAKCWRPFTGKHYDLARVMCNYWTNFAKYGDPNGPDADGSPMPAWDACEPGKAKRMLFSDECTMEDSINSELKEKLLDYYLDIVMDPDKLKSIKLPR